MYISYFAAILKKKLFRFLAVVRRHVPVQKNKILFDNINGKGYGGNPKYIAEEIQRRGLKSRMYWLVSDPKTELPPFLRKLEINTPRAEYELQSAGFIVDNVRRHWIKPKRKAQVYLQTWHGGYAMKKIEKDAEHQLPKNYVQYAQEDGRYCDGIVADGLQAETIYSSSFWLKDDCEILKAGTPRCDILVNEKGNPAIRKKVCDTLHADETAHLVLYAPTFRNNGSTVGYIKDFAEINGAFEKSFGKTVILARLHPNAVSLSMDLYKYQPGTFIDATGYPDPQELVLAADCLITDYSSIAFDFSLIRKPVFLCRKDLEEYRAERELYEIFAELPFPSGETEQEIANTITAFSPKEYQSALDAFYEKYPSYNTGHAAEQIVDWLIRKGLR